MININNVLWKIVLVKPNSTNLQRSDGVYTFGVTDFNTRCIYINQKLKEQMFLKVLSHELVHAYCFSYNYVVDIQTEEIIADFLSLFGKDIVYLCNDIMDMYYNNYKKI